MRKRLIAPIPQDAPPRDEGWLDLERAAVVEVTWKKGIIRSSLHWS